MKHSCRAIAGAIGLLLGTGLAALAVPASSDRIVGVEDSPPPFLTGFVPFDITVPETGSFESVTVPLGVATLPFSSGPPAIASSVLLLEPGGGAVSDIATIFATLTGSTGTTVSYSLELDFLSSDMGGLDPPPGFIASVDETGELLDISDLLFAPFTDRTGIVPTFGILVQSDIPEPGTMALLGTGLLGLAWGARGSRAVRAEP
ncbi:MAG: PEP-CTERM sorting domain-containing protein [Acetobacteraceae bacterium]